MKKKLAGLLFRKIKKVKKPYGYHSPAFAADFSGKWETIREEWDGFVSETHSTGKSIDELSEEQKDLNQDKKWKTLFLFGYSYYNENVFSHFPETFSLIRKWEKDLTLVMFSTMEPGKHIPAHQGNVEGVIRTQIGIDIREPELSFLRVEDKTVHLREREIFIFDDTFEHEAANRGNTLRTVLIIDSYRPLPLFYDLLNKLILSGLRNSAYVRNVLEKLK